MVLHYICWYGNTNQSSKCFVFLQDNLTCYIVKLLTKIIECSMALCSTTMVLFLLNVINIQWGYNHHIVEIISHGCSLIYWYIRSSYKGTCPHHQRCSIQTTCKHACIKYTNWGPPCIHAGIVTCLATFQYMYMAWIS